MRINAYVILTCKCKELKFKEENSELSFCVFFCLSLYILYQVDYAFPLLFFDDFFFIFVGGNICYIINGNNV